MPSAFKSPFRNEISVLGLPRENGNALEEAAKRRGSSDLGYDEDAFTRLKVAQDSLIEDLECKIVVSSVVGQSVLRGIARALSEESRELLASKNAEIDELEREKSRAVEESAAMLKKLAADYFDKLKQQELSILEKERDLSKLAENLIDLTFRLQGESLNNIALEKKMKEVVARDAAKQRKIDALTEEIESLRREQSSEIEKLKSEHRIKAARNREQLEKVSAEKEAELEALRAENLEYMTTISEVNEEVFQMIEAQNESMEAIGSLQRSLEEQKAQHEQEIGIVMDVYKGQVEDLYRRQCDMKLEYEAEIDVLGGYMETVCMRSVPEKEEEETVLYSIDSEMQVKTEMEELQKDIILDCFTGFLEDVVEAAGYLDQGSEQLASFLVDIQSGRQEHLAFQKNVSYWKSRSKPRYHAAGLQEKFMEQHYQHQLEMDVLLDFFVSNLEELKSAVNARSQVTLSEDSNEVQHSTIQIADLQRENASLRREKDQVLVDKTEEMFRLKRDFFKEIDKLRLEGGQYEFGILKNRFVDSRQKLDRILDMRHGDSSQRTSACIDENSDSDTASLHSEAAITEYGRYTEKLPVLVSELQDEINQLMLDTGMAKPDGKAHIDAHHELEVLGMEYESTLRALENEKRQNFAFTVELQELEHNINLSNGELERLLKQIEMEKQARLNKEGELQNVKQDVNLIKRQLEAVQGQLENERCQKLRTVSELELATQRIESFEKELSDVLKVKASVTEDHKRLRGEVIAIHQGISDVRSDLRTALEKQMNVMSSSFAILTRKLDERHARILSMDDRLAFLCKCASAKDKDRKRKLCNYLRNLRKAEQEVDLLGDENDYLINLLEKVFLALEHYSAVLQQYPGIADLSKLIKNELVGRA